MLAIGRALMAQPRVFLLDEPSLGLAPRIARDVAESLKAVAAKGAAVVIAEQNSGFVNPIADRKITLRKAHCELPDKGHLTCTIQPFPGPAFGQTVATTRSLIDSRLR